MFEPRSVLQPEVEHDRADIGLGTVGVVAEPELARLVEGDVSHSGVGGGGAAGLVGGAHDVAVAVDPDVDGHLRVLVEFVFEGGEAYTRKLSDGHILMNLLKYVGKAVSVIPFRVM